MLELACSCKHCTDVKIIQLSPFVYRVSPHTCRMDCSTWRDSTAPRPEDDFCTRFELLLPLELKIKCLSHCGVHRLFYPQLWFPEVGVHNERIAEDVHITGSGEHADCFGCGYMQYMDWCERETSVCIGFERGSPHKMSLRKPMDLTHVYGKINLYPAFYYRRCIHFDRCNKRKRGATRDVEQLLGRLNSSPAKHRRRYTKTYLNRSAECMMRPDSYKPKLDILPKMWDRAHTTIGPGVHYWELINYQWEATMAGMEGNLGRQRHFLLNPTARCAEDDKRIYMSLLLRRVAHPADEMEDEFITYVNFERVKPNTSTSMYFMLDGAEGPDHFMFSTDELLDYDSDDSDDGTVIASLEYPRPIYQHALTPDLGVRVFKSFDQETTVSYYRVTFPPKVQLHNLERNKNTLRVNFFIDFCDLSKEHKARIGVSLSKAVLAKINYGYAFSWPSVCIANNYEKSSSLFDALYVKSEDNTQKKE